MPFPTITAAGAPYEITAASATHLIDLPAHSAADRLLLILAIRDENIGVDSVSAVDGDAWGGVDGAAAVNSGNNLVRFAVYEIVSRTTSGAGQNVTVTLSASTGLAAQTVVIAGSDTTAGLEVRVTQGLSTQPTPGLLAPSWEDLDTLWLAGCCYGSDRALTRYPTGFVGATNVRSDVEPTGSIALGHANRELNAVNLDPSEFEIANGVIDLHWVAVTIAVPPDLSQPPPEPEPEPIGPQPELAPARMAERQLRRPEPPPETITVFSQLRDGTLVHEWEGVEDLRYSVRLNRPGACSFKLPNVELPGTDRLATVLEPGVHEVGIRKEGQLVWLGPLLTVDEEPFDAPGMVGFAAEGLMAYAKRWLVTGILAGATSTPTIDEETGETIPAGMLENTDQATILFRLLDHQRTKPGDDVFNLDLSQIRETGVIRTVVYDPAELPNIYDAWTELAEQINGFDTGVTPDRVVQVIYPQRSRRRKDVVLTTRDIIGFSRQSDATEQGSVTHGVGGDLASGTLRDVIQTTGAIAKFGRTENVFTNKGIGRPTTLRNQTTRFHRDRRRPRTFFTVTVDARFTDRLAFGDNIRVNYTSGYDHVDQWARVVGWEITGDTATLELGDQPYPLLSEEIRRLGRRVARLERRR